MPRVTDYCHNRNKKVEIKYKDVEEKLGKEPLSAEEIAMYLGTKKGDAITGKTIKNYIKKICDMSNNRLSLDNFKTNGKYVFLPRYHRLLLVLFDTDIFDSRKDENPLKRRMELNEQIIANVDQYIQSQTDKMTIKNCPSYVTSELETHLQKRINIEYAVLLKSLYDLPIAIRWKSMLEVLNNIINLRLWVQTSAIEFNGAKSICAKEKESIDAIQNKGLFADNNIENLIIKFLVWEVSGRKYTAFFDDEDITPDVAYLASLAYGYNEQTIETELIKIIRNIDVKIQEQEEYKAIDERLKKILNLENPKEECIYKIVMHFLKTMAVEPYMNSKIYAKMECFTLNALSDNVRKITNVFCGAEIERAIKAAIDLKDGKI